MATQRTRTASKALIPSLSDPVGKLNGLGGMTVKKLIDLGNQVREARSAVLADVPMASASTGGALSPPWGALMPAQPSLPHLMCLRVLWTYMYGLIRSIYACLDSREQSCLCGLMLPAMEEVEQAHLRP